MSYTLLIGIFKCIDDVGTYIRSVPLLTSSHHLKENFETSRTNPDMTQIHTCTIVRTTYVTYHWWINVITHNLIEWLKRNMSFAMTSFWVPFHIWHLYIIPLNFLWILFPQKSAIRINENIGSVDLALKKSNYELLNWRKI